MGLSVARMNRATNPAIAASIAALLLPLTLQAQNKAEASSIASGVSNTITKDANYSFIGSGWRNIIRTNGGGANGMSFIGSGMSNTVGASWSVINGGFLNRISPNSASGQMSFIGSGGENLILARYAVIAGGFSNAILAGGVGGAIGGGYSNEVSGARGTVPGGIYNEAAGANSLAAGFYAAAVDDGSFVWSDTSSTKVFESTGKNQFLIRAAGGVGINTNNPGTYALVVNGTTKITGNLSVATINGQKNFVGPQGPQGPDGPPGIQGVPGKAGRNGSNGAAAVISGVTVSNGPSGSQPTVSNTGNSTNAFFAFTFPLVLPSGGAGVGTNNTAVGLNSVVSGGNNNTAGTNYATIGGGSSNTNEAQASFIGGGAGNRIPKEWIDNSDPSNPVTTPVMNATVAGGINNTASGAAATVGGGQNNTARGNFSAIPGGKQNEAANYAFAAGRMAKAVHDGAFVWADSRDADFGSTASDQFLIRAGGGVGINTNNPGTNALSVNGTMQVGMIQVLTGGGAPTADAPDGSIYLNNQGKGPDDTLWFRGGGKWYQVLGTLPSPSPSPSPES